MSQPQADARGGVGSKSFIGLILTQLFGALNDNMFRWFAVGIAQPILGDAKALAVGLASFTIPYLIFAVPAGYLADRFSKRNVIVGCKIAEVFIMALGIASVLSGNAWFLLLVVALMGSQSALFGPSKFGSIPEIVNHENLSKANGLMGLTTIAASAMGNVAGYAIYGHIAEVRKLNPDITADALAAMPALHELSFAAMALIGVAIIGWMTSLLIRRLPSANPDRKPEMNPAMAIVRQMKLLKSDATIFRTAIGISLFWMLASLAQVNLDPFGKDTLQLDPGNVGFLSALLVIGVGTGSVLAGWLSKGKVELGIVPLGVAGIVVSCLLLWASGTSIDPTMELGGQLSFYLACVWLLTLGVSAGLFDIPLEANIQHRSAPEHLGTILAATNFLTFTFILASAGMFYVMKELLSLSAEQIFLVAGIGTIPGIYFSFRILPQQTIRFVVWMGSLFFYRLRVIGQEKIPEHGGAVLVANHVSWLDGILLIMVSDRPIRMVAYSDYVDVPGFAGWLCRTFGTIPIKSDGGPKALLRSLKTAREAAINGDLVCVFAEGGITRTGQLQPFQKGIMRIAEGTGVPVIPTYLDQLWGSVFSFHGGKFFWKKPHCWPYPITVMFGDPLPDPDDVEQVRRAVEDLGVEAVEHRHSNLIPARQFLRACRDARGRSKVADSAGMDLTGGKLLTASLVFRRVLLRGHLRPDEQNVGLLLPPSAGGAIVNAALSISGKVAVNLNYTLSEEVLNFCIKEAGIKRIITSRKVLEKRPMNLDAEFLLVEDLKEQITSADKLLSAISAYAEPVGILERRLGLAKIDPDDIMTVIFTSGSTGEPKGVMLSHNNVGSNITSSNQLFQFSETDVLLGILPFFHSFGYTLMMWLPLTLEPKGVYHFNPLDGRTIGKLCEKHGVTIVAATPTFLKTYLKRCTTEQMEKLDMAIVGAEKLPLKLAEDFHEKFGVWPTEGFGTTELSPLAIANVPDHRNNAASDGQTGQKMGTVGRPVPNVAAKIVDPDTREDLGLNQAGLLYIKGPNVMLGYLNNKEKTADVIRDGWYNTGDIAIIDDDSFITITGRLSRFSKIGGEMVPHIGIEEELARIVEDESSEEPEVRVAVTAVPDEKKGERIVVLHKPLGRPVDEVIAALAEAGLPNIWLPSADSFVEVEEIPLLGTGKLDLQGIKARAREAFPS
jgi:acyl-[acyl-carrier-protein]-phospholipid O-acyltransferase/long-chain-fatty-acid--[acyl-carrier-protein] ligase